MRGPGMAVAVALLFAALATAGCGLGPGNGVKDAELTVTRDYGTVPVLHRRLDDLTESDTVMRALERKAEITTSYGGDFVQSIDGVEGESRSGERFDWLFYVNGVESTVGAGAYSLHGGESVWWDYRDWSAALRVPAVVGSWPQPFLGGYEGKRRPVAVECLGGGSACNEVDERLKRAGVTVAAHSPSGAIRVLVGPWARVRSDPAAAQLERGPQASGVFADFHREGGAYRLVGLDEAGDAAVDFGPDSGLVAATRRYEEPPIWMVTGTSGEGVRAAADLLDAADLRDRYAVAVDRGKETPLPIPSR
ncbi:MAG: DUF4430 domain-containing protein [Thermoleophilia bacterium]